MHWWDAWLQPCTFVAISIPFSLSVYLWIKTLNLNPPPTVGTGQWRSSWLPSTWTEGSRGEISHMCTLLPASKKQIVGSSWHWLMKPYIRYLFTIKATLLDGAFHDVDSSSLAFEIAARACAKDGLKKAGLRLMEPIMQVRMIKTNIYHQNA